MKHLVLAAAVVFATVAVAPDAHGGGYSHGNGSGSCSFTPSTALVGQSFTVNAVGLPTGVEVDLVVTNYEAPTHTYGPLAVNPDGSWSGTYTVPDTPRYPITIAARPPATRMLPRTNGQNAPRNAAHGARDLIGRSPP